MSLQTAQFTLAVFFMVVCFLIAGWDVIVGQAFGGEYTVSNTVQDWIGKYPPLMAFVFFTLGHLVWPLIRRGGGGP